MSHACFEYIKKNKIQKMDPMTQMPWAINYRLLKSKLILVAHGYKPMSKPKKLLLVAHGYKPMSIPEKCMACAYKTTSMQVPQIKPDDRPS